MLINYHHLCVKTKGSTKPDRNSIKINIVASCNFESSSIAAVARDWRGELVFACSKRVNTTLPLQAEAEAINRAVNLALNLDFDSICIVTESPKACIDALIRPNMDVLWRIRSICLDVLALKS